MNDERDEQKILAENAYLWESGEWTLFVAFHSRARIIFVFPDGRPTLRELTAVRALLPEFTAAPTSHLKETLGHVHEYVAGEFENLSARDLERKARERGLKTRREDTSFVSKLPVSREGPLLIEDNRVAKLVTDEMERRGVPLTYAEGD